MVKRELDSHDDEEKAWSEMRGRMQCTEIWERKVHLDIQVRLLMFFFVSLATRSR